MLSFDLETEGLNPSIDRIAVACIYDPYRNIEVTFNFLDTDDKDIVNRRVNEFLKHLDEAPAICCFNGVKFDIPFIVERFKVPPARVHSWMLKVFDMFEICRLVFRSSCSLDSILQVLSCFQCAELYMK